MLQRVGALPGVERVSFASTVPFGEITEGRTVRLSPADAGVPALFDVVGAGYFDTLGLRMVRGREFTPAKTSRAAARSWPSST